MYLSDLKVNSEIRLFVFNYKKIESGEFTNKLVNSPLQLNFILLL